MYMEILDTNQNLLRFQRGASDGLANGLGFVLMLAALVGNLRVLAWPEIEEKRSAKFYRRNLNVMAAGHVRAHMVL